MSTNGDFANNEYLLLLLYQALDILISSDNYNDNFEYN